VVACGIFRDPRERGGRELPMAIQHREYRRLGPARHLVAGDIVCLEKLRQIFRAVPAEPSDWLKIIFEPSSPVDLVARGRSADELPGGGSLSPKVTWRIAAPPRQFRRN
jgi:hypothetical protein